jgi:hypothetical protein
MVGAGALEGSRLPAWIITGRRSTVIATAATPDKNIFLIFIFTSFIGLKNSWFSVFK